MFKQTGTNNHTDAHANQQTERYKSILSQIHRRMQTRLNHTRDPQSRMQRSKCSHKPLHRDTISPNRTQTRHTKCRQHQNCYNTRLTSSSPPRTLPKTKGTTHNSHNLKQPQPTTHTIPITSPHTSIDNNHTITHNLGTRTHDHAIPHTTET